jgi:chromosome partitioning protein
MFAGEGREVLLVDADPEQHSAMNWCADRPEHLPKVHSSSLLARNLRKDADALRQKWEVVIIDGGARVTEYAHAAVAAADWLVIPVKPSKVDLDATAQFLDVVQSDMAKRDDLSGGAALKPATRGNGDRERSARTNRGMGISGFQERPSLLCRFL